LGSRGELATRRGVSLHAADSQARKGGARVTMIEKEDKLGGNSAKALGGPLGRFVPYRTECGVVPC